MSPASILIKLHLVKQDKNTLQCFYCSCSNKDSSLKPLATSQLLRFAKIRNTNLEHQLKNDRFCLQWSFRGGGGRGGQSCGADGVLLGEAASTVTVSQSFTRIRKLFWERNALQSLLGRSPGKYWVTAVKQLHQSGWRGGCCRLRGSFGWQAFSLASGSRPQGELMQLCGFTSQHASVHGVGVIRWPLKLVSLDDL